MKSLLHAAAVLLHAAALNLQPHDDLKIDNHNKRNNLIRTGFTVFLSSLTLSLPIGQASSAEGEVLVWSSRGPLDYEISSRTVATQSTVIHWDSGQCIRLTVAVGSLNHCIPPSSSLDVPSDVELDLSPRTPVPRPTRP